MNTKKPIRHGTTGGHRAHFRRGEPMCEPCRDAERRYRGREPMRSAACGTRSGYNGHRHRSEEPCAACREAVNAYATQRRATIALAPGDARHGTVNGYANYACRCEPCKAAGVERNRRDRERRRAATR